MTERRLEDRFLCADLVRLDWWTEESDVHTTEAVLEDICPHGACVQVEEPIPVKAEILISAGPGHAAREKFESAKRDCEPVDVARFFGHVSYCEYREYGYFAGIRFSDETQWSSRVFEPQHLMNLAAFSQARE